MRIMINKLNFIINILCIIMLVGTTAYLIINWAEFPEKVPMHSNFMGETDRWGSKNEMIILPVISWIIYVSMTIIEHFPQIWNTGVKVTVQNRERVYRALNNLLITIKLLIVGVFTYLTIQTALSLQLPSWFLTAFMTVLFGDMFFWIWKLMRAK